ncbi:hypothetical protein M407DRAFT_3629 [Tulasnella calospora MUT 4182]|uniref:Carboxypeptidase n=1 Tax=Tulasnella calospora MUT 4182 TaxID=1051891 RepID=A0A0C3QWH5_9AGAM|nr:hypothetical protein M407DRAFT_3629 [Tulasnella calospora MUT 4182]
MKLPLIFFFLFLGNTLVAGNPLRQSHYPLGWQTALSPSSSWSASTAEWLHALASLFRGAGPLKSSDAISTSRLDETGFRTLDHPDFPGHKIRVKSPRLCDPNVKQYSGYLDTDDDKHFFFWFFESRQNPSEAPIVMWLNGDANMIFLDQPVNVGFSYSNTSVTDSPTAAQDVYAFLQLFFKAYPKYASAPFSIAAESYGGVYAPHIATAINRKNKALERRAQAPHSSISSSKLINLSTLMLGNGLTEPRTQLGVIATNACHGPYPVFDNPTGPECLDLEAKGAECRRLVQKCYDVGTADVCGGALNWCDENIFSVPELTSTHQKLGLNPFDTRAKCANSPWCYLEMEWYSKWLNNQAVKAELGVHPSLNFTACNWELNKVMTDGGEGAKNSAVLIPELLADGIRVLVYGGNACMEQATEQFRSYLPSSYACFSIDFLVPPVGYLEWMSKLDSVFKEEFIVAPILPWTTTKNSTMAGVVKAAGGNITDAGNFTYVSVFEAGHMMPHDQPEAALYMFKRWLDNKSLVERKVEDE